MLIECDKNYMMKLSLKVNSNHDLKIILGTKITNGGKITWNRQKEQETYQPTGEN